MPACHDQCRAFAPRLPTRSNQVERDMVTSCHPNPMRENRLLTVGLSQTDAVPLALPYASSLPLAENFVHITLSSSPRRAESRRADSLAKHLTYPTITPVEYPKFARNGSTCSPSVLATSIVGRYVAPK